MKKIKAMLMVGMIVFSALAFVVPVIAPNGTVVSIEDVSIGPTESKTVPIMIENVEGVVVASVNLTYNPSVVHVTGVGDSEFVDFCGDTTDNTIGFSRIAVMNYTVEGLTGDIRLANVTLEAVGSAEDWCYLNLTVEELKKSGEISIEATVDNGRFTITGVAAPKVVINEFVSDNATEWVELYNNGSSPVDLTGWTLEDNGGNSKSLSSLGTIGVAGYKVFTCGSGWLNNPGDVIWLNSTTENVDRVGYGTSGGAPAPDAGNSTGRYPNGVDTNDDAKDFREFGTPTPGTANELPAEEDTTAPTTVVTAPPDVTAIPSGTELPWTNGDVIIFFRRTDNVGGTGVDYTNYSKTSETGPWTTVNATTAIGPDADNVSDITDATFNVTVSDEGITPIYYYSVDKNVTPNVEDTKNLTVRIDKTAPDIMSVELNKTPVNASEQINVSVNVIDPINGGVASGIATVTADGVGLTKQNGNWWNGTITAAATAGTHNVTVIAYDNASNTATNDTMQYEVKVIAEITTFYVENPTAGLGQNFTARINITTTEYATAGWYVVVVSGVATTGEGLAGIGTVYMEKSDSVGNMPVLVHIPQVTSKLSYELYAGLYRLEDYPSNLENIIDYEGPVTVTVT